MIFQCSVPEAVAKRAFWLAYKAATRSSVGPLVEDQKIDATEEGVWRNVNSGGYTRYANILLGRAVYLRLAVQKKDVESPDSVPDPMSQSWAPVYPTYQALMEAAVREVTDKLVSV